MRGLELARRYYDEVGRPMLERDFPELLPRIAAGLVGEGSECLGFDDDISQDHDFGPGFCLWLTREDYLSYGARLQDAYEALPGDFLGFSPRKDGPRAGKRVGVFEISTFYRDFVGGEQPPASLRRWLYLPEDKLAAVTSGQVFEDPFGEFSRLRKALLAYYPEDVRVKKIAARAAQMAQSGQYNYARCMRRGDGVAAQLALLEFLKSALSMVYLLNCRYEPYYKWAFRGLRDLPRMRAAQPLFLELSTSGGQESAWRGKVQNPYVNRLDRKVVLMEEICRLTIEELRTQGLTDGTEDFLEHHTWRIMERIQDARLRGLHVLEG
jgi:hypothetical protein